MSSGANRRPADGEGFDFRDPLAHLVRTPDDLPPCRSLGASLEAGASLDEVSEAVGHSSPVVTKRFYDHHVRRSFSDILTARLPAK